MLSTLTTEVLGFLAVCQYNFNAEKQQTHIGGDYQHDAKLLDSIAQVSSREKGGAVAIAAVILPNKDGVKILVSESGVRDPKNIVDYLTYIFETLREIKNQIRAQDSSRSELPSQTVIGQIYDADAGEKFKMLAEDMLKFVLPKFKIRVRKQFMFFKVFMDALSAATDVTTNTSTSHGAHQRVEQVAKTYRLGDSDRQLLYKVHKILQLLHQFLVKAAFALLPC
ncbi:hypothetical protein C8Q75DRAFT_502332 [Abortiporus biennis]|nr:hypothetical protein C8Q75DRAFT_502332 [Abortiporus biennis]